MSILLVYDSKSNSLLLFHSGYLRLILTKVPMIKVIILIPDLGVGVIGMTKSVHVDFKLSGIVISESE